MNNQEILQKAMRRARKNGYNKQMERRLAKENGIDITIEPGEGLVSSVEKYSIPTRLMVLSHDFAKAFWPGKRLIQVTDAYLDDINEIDGGTLHEWQFHLQQMVLEEDPIKYLKQFLSK